MGMGIADVSMGIHHIEALRAEGRIEDQIVPHYDSRTARLTNRMVPRYIPDDQFSRSSREDPRQQKKRAAT